MPNRRTLAFAPAAITAAILITLASAWLSLTRAIHRSQDFQWSGERLLFQHVDPWRDYLLGDPAHALIGTQVPNYLPVLYVLLTPFGLLPATAANLAWAICNVAFAIVSAILAARFYHLRSPAWIAAITAILLSAVPTRTAIGNGQQCLFVLFLWSVALLTTSRPLSRTRAAITGISYLKYSFAPAIALYLALHGSGRGTLPRQTTRNGLRNLFFSLVPSAVATILLWLWITGPHTLRNLAALIVEPLAVAKSGYQPTSDPGITLMDLGEFALGGNLIASPRLTAITFTVAITLTAAVLVLALRRLQHDASTQHDAQKNTCLHPNAAPLHADSAPIEASAKDGATGWLLALTATMSFTFYKHHAYDEVVFLFPLCYALQHRTQPAARAALALIAYHWFIQRLFDPYLHFSWLWNTLRLLSFCALLTCIYFTPPRVNSMYPQNR